MTRTQRGDLLARGSLCNGDVLGLAWYFPRVFSVSHNLYAESRTFSSVMVPRDVIRCFSGAQSIILNVIGSEERTAMLRLFTAK